MLPLVILLLGIAFNGWNAMQESIRLTSVARAGAIVAAQDLSGPNGSNTRTVLDDATNAVNEEEFGPGVPGIYQDDDSSANNYVSMSPPTTQNANGLTIKVVTITISQSSASFVPFVGSFPVTTHATASYS